MKKLCIFLIIALIIFCSHDVFSRTPFTPDLLTLNAVVDLQGIYTTKYKFDKKARKGRSVLVKYDFKTGKVSPLKNSCLLNNSVHSLTGTKNKLFITTSKGIMIYDKSKKNCEAWHEFENIKINALALHKNKLWLGTDNGIVEVNFSTKKTEKTFSTKDGLNSNKVYTLYYVYGKLLVGTYRNGVPPPHECYEQGLINRIKCKVLLRNKGINWYETNVDIFGTGMNVIDLKNNKIQEIRLPDWKKKKYKVRGKESLVADIYPASSTNKKSLRFLLWQKWEYSAWDYDLSKQTFSEVKENIFPLYPFDKILNTNGKDINSSLAAHLINYSLGQSYDGKPYWFFWCAVIAMYKRGEIDKIDNLMKSKNIEIRKSTMRALSVIRDTQTSKYIIASLKDGIDVTTAHELIARKETAAVPELRRIFKLHQYSLEKDDSFWALNALIDLEPSIIDEILVSGEEFEKKLLGSCLSIRGDEEKLMDAVMNKGKSPGVRRGAIYVLRKYHYDNINYIRDLSKFSKFYRFLKKSSNNKNEDPTIRNEARLILDMHKKSRS